MQKIAIIGAGDIGKAIGGVLEKNSAKNKNLEVFYWDKDSLKMPEEKELSEVVSGADFLFLCLPSWVVRDALREALPFLDKKTVVVCLAKGIEGGGSGDDQAKLGKTMDEVLKEVLSGSGQGFALLGGSMLAEEIVEGKFSAGVLASHKKEVAGSVAKLFENSNIKIELSGDVSGVALCGVLKNIYAVALGIADGLFASDNAKGYIASKSLKEMKNIVGLLGGEEETVLGAAGLGDLITTGFSECSHNKNTGCRIAKGEKGVKSEGTVALTSVISLLGERAGEFSFLNKLDRILSDEEDVDAILK